MYQYFCLCYDESMLRLRSHQQTLSLWLKALWRLNIQYIACSVDTSQDVNVSQVTFTVVLSGQLWHSAIKYF